MNNFLSSFKIYNCCFIGRMPSTPAAVVTGSNKGIGFAVVRALCKQFPGDVYLTSRDIERGKEAVAKLQKEGLKPLFHQLDINDLQSIHTFHDFLKEKYGGLNVLVNNAGIAFKGRTLKKLPGKCWCCILNVSFIRFYAQIYGFLGSPNPSRTKLQSDLEGLEIGPPGIHGCGVHG